MSKCFFLTFLLLDVLERQCLTWAFWAESKHQLGAGRDSVPATQYQEKHGHAAGDREPELGTWPMGPIIQTMIPWTRQMDTHINIRLKENFWLALMKQNITISAA